MCVATGQAYLSAYSFLTTARRPMCGDERVWRVVVLGVVVAVAIVQLATTAQEEPCFFGRDTYACIYHAVTVRCGGVTQPVCELSEGIASVSLIAALVLALVVLSDTIRVGVAMLWHVIPAGVMCALALACGIIMGMCCLDNS